MTSEYCILTQDLLLHTVYNKLYIIHSYTSALLSARSENIDSFSVTVASSSGCKKNHRFILDLFLTPHTAAVLIHALVTSRIDYCKSLLSSFSQKRNELIQNSASRIITRKNIMHHITLSLQELQIPNRV